MKLYTEETMLEFAAAFSIQTYSVGPAKYLEKVRHFFKPYDPWISVEDEKIPEFVKVIFQSTHLYDFPDNVFTGIRRGDEMHFSNRVMFAMDNFTIPISQVIKFMYISGNEVEPLPERKEL